MIPEPTGSIIQLGFYDEHLNLLIAMMIESVVCRLRNHKNL